MCVIVVKPVGKSVTRKRLKSCWTSNEDGGGFAYAKPNEEIVIEKGFFTFRKFYRAFRAAEREYPNTAFLLHMRIATSGLIDKVNCHPFQINDDMVFAHNGIFNDFTVKDSLFSDTWNFNEGVLRSYLLGTDELYTPGVMHLLENYVSSTGCKLGILDKYGMYHIVNEEDGVWVEGVWFSNYSFYPLTQKTFGFARQTRAIGTSKAIVPYTKSLEVCYFCGMYENREEMDLRIFKGQPEYLCSKCSADLYKPAYGSTYRFSDAY